MTETGFDLIVGLGMSGVSAAAYLHAQATPLRVMDSRAHPAGVEAFRQRFTDIPVHLGSFRRDWLLQCRRIILSPGIAPDTPDIAEAAANGKEVISDIELFARVADAPIAAITGSNAKSSVTTLLAQAATACHQKALAGGNLAPAALDMLNQDADLYALELSSFQLETTYSLKAQVATILNISADHLDRHHNMAAYIAAKQRIYEGCHVAVWNRDDEATRPPAWVVNSLSFGIHDAADFRLDITTGELLAHGSPMLNSAELTLSGSHNALNALAVLAMAEALDLPREPVLQAVRHFTGLPYRCQRIAVHNGVSWYNDSKGTNVGASQAAIQGVGGSIQGKVILLAGGQGKGQDFSPLAGVAQDMVRQALVFGEDADALARALTPHTRVQSLDGLQTAVQKAAELAQPGDAVLLSPACASFDQFKNYIARGDAFTAMVKEVTHD